MGQEIPSKINVGNAYPNPFNPIVGFNYELPMEADVDIRVFNVNGQEISILHQGIVKSGLHEVAWNADSFSSGMYFIKAESAGNVDVQKIMLMK